MAKPSPSEFFISLTFGPSKETTTDVPNNGQPVESLYPKVSFFSESSILLVVLPTTFFLSFSE
jgi:hypothetical protein